MEIRLLTVGKTTVKFVADGIAEYERRLRHYVPFSIVSIPDIRNTRKLSTGQHKEAEGRELLSQLSPSDYVMLLDEHGKEFTSMMFASEMEKRMASGCRRIVFCVGGPYGFSEEMHRRADAEISLSRLTFPHELVRLLFVEQLYRAFTILRGEPYHHE